MCCCRDATRLAKISASLISSSSTDPLTQTRRRLRVHTDFGGEREQQATQTHPSRHQSSITRNDNNTHTIRPFNLNTTRFRPNLLYPYSFPLSLTQSKSNSKPKTSAMGRRSELATMTLNAATLALYSYAWFFLLTDAKARKMDDLVPESHRKFGPLRFLTMQCLCIQWLSSALHLAAYFKHSLRPTRDAIFTSLAYPVGSIVVYSFWAVWHIMGRELIFPAALSEYIPDWLNHSMHTVIAPANIATALMVHHEYTWWGSLVMYAFFGAYMVMMLTVKLVTGTYVYKFLDTLGEAQVTMYFVLTALIAYGFYVNGRWLNRLPQSCRKGSTSSFGK